ncbi:MAG: sulfite exporter TauE/SafE family protein [Vicinamibacterales bacterium]
MDLVRVAAGALTGFVVGMTGVGGGALMTPILLLFFGTAPLTAVGTDLWFAAITKLAVSGLHLRSRVIDWPIVVRLWMGSLPTSLLAVAWMASRPADPGAVLLVRGAIGVAVCLSAASLLFGARLRPAETGSPELGTVPGVRTWDTALTVAMGSLLGALVTVTSVGAGALGAVFLYHLYPRRLTPLRLVATDIAHAIPLALCAGLGHLAISQVDGALLRDLLVGSVPAALAGAALSGRVPHGILRTALGGMLLVVGLLMLGAAIR